MQLKQLIEALPTRSVTGTLDRRIGAITRDSRDVGSGDVFVAIRGARVDGHDLIGSVPEAAAVVVERPVDAPEGVTVIEVDNTKRSLALLAAARHGHPARQVRVVGITGTNGKTTVATLVEGALLELGHRVARVGTTGNAVDGVLRPSAFTTPEAPALQAFLAELRDSGVGVLVMEVSSIGLAQHRVDGIDFFAAAFTNLTQDHLDFHGDMDAYASAKARLFRELLREEGGAPRALLYADDPAHRHMGAPADCWTYGFGNASDLRIEDARIEANGTGLRVQTPEGPVALHSPMVGRHNAANLACALGLLRMLGTDLEEAAEALSAVAGVPGRLELVPDPRKERLVAVDYAHTPDALEHALRTLREVTKGRLHVVFGCGGDRDRGKRPQMAAVAEALADRVIVTSDNPRSEEPRAIVDEVVGGFSRPVGVTVEVDRRSAIRLAVACMSAGDSLLIAGKGHETYQEVKGVRAPFDDRLEARRALEG